MFKISSSDEPKEDSEHSDGSKSVRISDDIIEEASAPPPEKEDLGDVPTEPTILKDKLKIMLQKMLLQMIRQRKRQMMVNLRKKVVQIKVVQEKVVQKKGKRNQMKRWNKRLQTRMRRRKHPPNPQMKKRLCQKERRMFVALTSRSDLKGTETQWKNMFRQI